MSIVKMTRCAKCRDTLPEFETNNGFCWQCDEGPDQLDQFRK